MSKSFKDKKKYVDKHSVEYEGKPLKFKKKKRFDASKLMKLEPEKVQQLIDEEEFE